MGSYDKINQLKAKYESQLKEKDEIISALEKKNKELQDKYDALRKEMHDAGLGKSKVSELQSVITKQEREKKTIKNQLRELDGSKYIHIFSPERQELLLNIKKLSFANSNYNALAVKFVDGLDNIIQLAYRIKNGSQKDMDFFTYIFRDNVIGLFEKMLRVVLNTKEDSASKYLVKILNGEFTLPKEYLTAIPAFKDKNRVNNLLLLINLETSGYHGTNKHRRSLQIDSKSNKLVKPDDFLNLDKDAQLDAIFTLLEFMYFVFTNKDYEQNLLLVSNYWFKTI